MQQNKSVRTILVPTVGRSDFGIGRQIMERIAATPGLRYELLVSGAHLSTASGMTVRELEAEGRPIGGRILLPDSHGSEAATSAAMGVALAGAAAFLSESRPDMMLLIGDRFEMFAIAAAAVPLNIPLAHVHGGEVSFGSTDEVFRHAITKMAHLHFPTTAEYAARIERMGEEPWRVTVAGAPSLDNVRLATLPSRQELSQRFGLPLDEPPLLVTYHPVTRRPGEAERQVEALLGALAQISRPVVITAPNADAGSDVIRREIERFVVQHQRSWLVESFGSLNYLAMLRESAAMVGNSSSGLIETPAFELPTVNIGDRQEGRTRGRNVIDVEASTEAILAGMRQALDPVFRSGLSGMANPYGDGHAAERIVEVLAKVEFGARLIVKRFYDGSGGAA
jgi:UDP-hydrolysing UDP-N-acetyl-D-glucosamine 2-epimerase